MSKKKNSKKSKDSYSNFLNVVNQNIINTFNDLQNSRDKIYNRAIGTATLVLAVLGLSFIKYDDLSFYQLLNSNLIILVFVIMLMTAIFIFIIIMFIFFVKTLYTKKHCIIGYSYYVDNNKQLKDFTQYDEDELLLSLNKSYTQPLNQLKEYVDNIGKSYTSMLIYSIILLVLSIINFFVSLFF